MYFLPQKFIKVSKKKKIANYKYTYDLDYIIEYRPVNGQKPALNLNLNPVLDLTCPKPNLTLNLNLNLTLNLNLNLS